MFVLLAGNVESLHGVHLLLMQERFMAQRSQVHNADFYLK